jgi:hypothetical protein
MENVSWYGKQLIWFEKYRIGAMTLMMSFLSVYGAIGSMLSLRNDFYPGVILTSVFSMTSLVLFIAQPPAKWSMGAFYAGLVVNTIFIIIGLAML